MFIQAHMQNSNFPDISTKCSYC